MAYRCQICDKTVAHGFNVSHSKRHTKRIWRPNVQRVRARVNGETRHIYVCTRCLKAGKVERAL